MDISNTNQRARRDVSWLTDATFFSYEETVSSRPESFIRSLDGRDHTIKDQTRTDLDIDAVNKRLDELALEQSDMEYGYEW